MKVRDGMLLELNSKARQLQVRFFFFIALITSIIISAGLINYTLHETNEQLENANRLSQEQFTNLQQVSEKFRLLSTGAHDASPRTLEPVKTELRHLASKILLGQEKLQNILTKKQQENSFFWPKELNTIITRLSDSEIEVIRWVEEIAAHPKHPFTKESLRFTHPLKSSALLQNHWHSRLVKASKQFNTHIQANFRTTRFVIWSTFLGLFLILWMMYSAIIQPALFRIQQASDRSQSKLDLQTALATFLEEVSSKGSHLFDKKTNHSKVLNTMLHKHLILNQWELNIKRMGDAPATTPSSSNRIRLSEKLHCSGSIKEQTLCIKFPNSLRDFEADILPFLKALANHLSALFEINLRMAAESQRDTYYQIVDTAVNSLPTPVIVFDKSQRAMLINPAFQSFFPGLQQTVPSDITLPALSRHNNSLMSDSTDNSSDIFVTGSFSEISISYTNEKNVVWSRLPVKNLGIVFIGHDITTIRDDLTEKEYTRRLKYLGQMSVSVAHDTNNHLAIIMNILEIIGLRAKLTEDNTVLLEEAINSCQKASSISRQLVSFSRRQNLIPTTILPSTVAKYVEQFLFKKAYKNIQLSIDLDEDARIFCDPEHLKNTILNIVKNSVEAIQTDGLISLSIQSVNSYMVSITIADTGPGFSENDFEQATDPFYTTKDGSAGLGLAGAHGFTQQSKGSLSFVNNKNGGASIELHLPKSHIAMSEQWEDQLPPGNSELRTKGLSILLVEDNEMLSDLITVEFERSGYEVYSASSVEDGIKIIAEIETLDVLITDIILPDGLGFRLAQELIDYFPNTGVVYVTGYGSEEYTTELKKNPGRVLEKPFSILKLIDLVELAYKELVTSNSR